MSTNEQKKKHSDFVLDVIAGLEAMGIVVYGERIAVIRDPEEEMIGSIIVPDSAQKKEPRGTVVAHGLGIAELDTSRTAGMHVGDRIMYTKYNPIEFIITLPDGEKAKLEVMHVSDLYLGWRE